MLQLFGYAEIESEERRAAIAHPPECRRWWTHLRDLMVVNADDSPVSTGLQEVFGLA